MTVAKVETSRKACLVTLDREYMGNWKQTRVMLGQADRRSVRPLRERRGDQVMHLKEIAEVADNLRTSLRLVIHELEKAEEVEDPDKAVEMRQKAVRDLKEIAGE
jgi:hypothetical protein